MVRNFKTKRKYSQALLLGIVASVSLFSLPAFGQVIVLEPASKQLCSEELANVKEAERAYDLQQERLGSALDRLSALQDRARQIESSCGDDQDCLDENHYADTQAAIQAVRATIAVIEKTINRLFEELLEADAELTACLHGSSSTAAGSTGQSR